MYAGYRRPLWSADNRMCLVKRSRNQCGDRCFVTAGPTLWNSQPEQLWQLDITFGQFKRSLKTLCLVSWAAASCVWTLSVLTRNLLTYLLTHTETQRDRERTCCIQVWLRRQLSSTTWSSISAERCFSSSTCQQHSHRHHHHHHHQFQTLSLSYWKHRKLVCKTFEMWIVCTLLTVWDGSLYKAKAMAGQAESVHLVTK